MSFRPRSEPDLQALSDEALIAYIRAAHGAGDDAARRQALGILVYGHWPNVERRVKMKVDPADVEDVTADILMQAFTSAFDGTSVGEFVNWLKTITARRIADHYRRGPGAERTVPIGPPDDEESAGREPVDPGHGEYVEVVDVIDAVMDDLAPDHRRVVELVIFDDRPARDAADAVAGMTEANVYQVVSRFRRDLRAALDDDGPRL